MAKISQRKNGQRDKRMKNLLLKILGGVFIVSWLFSSLFSMYIGIRLVSEGFISLLIIAYIMGSIISVLFSSVFTYAYLKATFTSDKE